MKIKQANNIVADLLQDRSFWISKKITYDGYLKCSEHWKLTIDNGRDVFEASCFKDLLEKVKKVVCN